MNEEQKKATWVFIVLTAMRKRLGLSQADLVSTVSQYSLVSFLFDFFELLHYYDNEYVIGDMLKYIEEQGGDVDALQRAV